MRRAKSVLFSQAEQAGNQAVRCGGKRKPSFQMGNVGRIHYGTVGTLRLAHISSQRSVLPEGLLQYYGMIESGPVRVSFQMDLSAAVGVS